VGERLSNKQRQGPKRVSQTNRQRLPENSQRLSTDSVGDAGRWYNYVLTVQVARPPEHDGDDGDMMAANTGDPIHLKSARSERFRTESKKVVS
jgi:hypothetical protein